jgi:NAD(P)H-dependent FMN reductase
MRILGLCGSLRAGSCHRGLLRAAPTAMPAGVALDVVEIGALTDERTIALLGKAVAALVAWGRRVNR